MPADTRPFKFGVMAKTGGDARALRDIVRRVEDQGYDSYLFNDHYIGDGPALRAANHPVQDTAAIPTIMLAAAYSERLVVGHRVLCIDYHHPVVLAKELATINLFSDGRLEIGLGAGWITSEYEAMGIPMDSAGTRIKRLSEVTDFLRAAFSGDELDFRGTTVHAVGFQLPPATSQRGCPPIVIGGGGPKVLELAARKADVVTFNLDNRSGKIGPDGARRANADAVAEKIAIVRDAAGDRWPTLELELGAHLSAVTDDARGVAAAVGQRFELSADDVLAHPHALIGTPEAIADMIVERREHYGFNRFLVLEHLVDAFAPVVAKLAGK
jgi:probable F420-dependent oxidoreductase